ncbi:MAG: ThiF family adenylyltransferase [Deltaproteobacteria bacterium]|nr:ThiF family adenylyltransferase [Deltaproteobacteria bacterium]
MYSADDDIVRPAFSTVEKRLRFDDRLDRQLRMQGWDQAALDGAKIGVVGDDDLLASLYIVSASALGINNISAVAPVLDETLIETAKRVNPRLNLMFTEGFYTHPVMDDVFNNCSLIVDLSHYGLANKLLLEKGYRENVPIVRGFCYEKDGQQGFKVFAYRKGREWQELEHIVSPNNLPDDHFDDGVLDIIVSGIVLEETKSLLMSQKVSKSIISYERSKLGEVEKDQRILVTGSGALGVFVGLGLAYAGFLDGTFLDPDVAETTNLNRQVLFYDAVGESKAETLARRLSRFFSINAKAQIGYFKRDTDISSYTVVFDCVDNFETRIVISEKCEEQQKIMISGGTNVDAGQALFYNPAVNGRTPAELLGLYDIVDKRTIDAPERVRASCKYRPDPSVIMTNQIIAGFMVDSYRMILAGQIPQNFFYDSTRDGRMETGSMRSRMIYDLRMQI